MLGWFGRYERVAVVFWVLALGTIPLWSSTQVNGFGWDLRVYRNAVHSVAAGHDPYADGIAVQEAYHRAGPHPAGEMPPYTYVYAPVTLPVLQVIAAHPRIFRAGLYWMLYAVGTLSAIWVGMQAAERGERKFVALAAPAAIYFPGLLQGNVVLSGNVANVLYGVIFAAALLGWRRGRWALFYVAVLAASCCKAPMLTLLAIPVLSARRQWWPAGVTAGAALAIFALQPRIWPGEFHHYLEAVALQFSYNRDFGVSPAGMAGYALVAMKRPYAVGSGVVYVAYALGLWAVMVRLGRRFRAGEISLGQWMPMVLLGSMLLNPRIKEYDVAALTVPMAMLLWRLCGVKSSAKEQVWKTAAVMLAFNWVVTSDSDHLWQPGCCLWMVGLFGLGSWLLLRGGGGVLEADGEAEGIGSEGGMELAFAGAGRQGGGREEYL